jgi:hypothetical protein
MSKIRGRVVGLRLGVVAGLRLGVVVGFTLARAVGSTLARAVGFMVGGIVGFTLVGIPSSLACRLEARQEPWYRSITKVAWRPPRLMCPVLIFPTWGERVR